MKVPIRNYGVRMSTEQRQVLKAQAADVVRTRGTARIPGSPRDLLAQAGPRGILLNWRAPAGQSNDIAGWRVYKDTETALYAVITDPNTTQHFIESTAGSAPPVTNLFVSSINQLNVESPKVQVQSNAITEAGAPTMPSTPPTYNRSGNGFGGGRCFSGNTRVLVNKKPNGLGIQKYVQIDQIRPGDFVLSRAGWQRVAGLIKSAYTGPVYDMGRAELVKGEHRFFERGDWVKADSLFPKRTSEFAGEVYNLSLQTETDSDDEHCYMLANGRFAHNVKP